MADTPVLETGVLVRESSSLSFRTNHPFLLGDKYCIEEQFVKQTRSPLEINGNRKARNLTKYCGNQSLHLS